MQRRDFVKAIVAASVTAKGAMAQQGAGSLAPATPPPAPPLAAPAAPGPVPWMKGLLDVKQLPMTALVPDAVAQTNAQFFTVKQTATLQRLCEVLLPSIKGFPGARDVETPEFLDFLIGASPAEQQQLYQMGLDRLEAEATKAFNISFATTSAAQADQLIRPWLRTWMTDHPPLEPYARFVNVAHSDIRTATINSEKWDAALREAGKQTPEIGLYWFPIEPDLNRERTAASGIKPGF